MKTKFKHSEKIITALILLFTIVIISLILHEKEFNIQDHVLTYSPGSVQNINNFEKVALSRDLACSKDLDIKYGKKVIASKLVADEIHGCVTSIVTLDDCPEMTLEKLSNHQLAARNIKGYREEFSPEQIKSCGHSMLVESTKIMLKMGPADNGDSAIQQAVDDSDPWNAIPAYEHPAPELSEKLNELQSQP